MYVIPVLLILLLQTGFASKCYGMEPKEADQDTTWDDFFCQYSQIILLREQPLILTMREDDGKEIPVMTESHERKCRILTFGCLSEKKNELLNLKVKGDKWAAASQGPCPKVIASISSLCMRFAQLDEWEKVIDNARFLVTRNNLNLWYGILIDSLFELYKEHGFTKLILAIELDYENKLADWIGGYLEFCSTNNVDPDINACGGNTTALISAVDKGLIDVVCALLAAGANANASNEEGTTPLIFAASKGSVEMMALLLDKGALVNSQDAKSFTALHHAVSHKQENAIALLLSHNAPLELREKETNMTPLLMAIDRRFSEGVCLLLDGGADPNALSHVHNFSTLMFAIAEYTTASTAGALTIPEETEKTFKVVQRIISDTRIDFDWKNEQGYTALKIAQEYDLGNIVKLINERKKA